ncbi:MAG: GGDEF domain-containing protein [bacterium]
MKKNISYIVFLYIIIVLAIILFLGNSISNNYGNYFLLYLILFITTLFLFPYFYIKKKNLTLLTKSLILLSLGFFIKIIGFYVSNTYLFIITDLMLLFSVILLCNKFITIISRYQENLQEANYFSYHDKLTGLYNRRFIDYKLDEKNNLEIPVSIIIADIYNLKKINDRFGHAKGDEIIKKAGNIINSVTRKNDIVGRIGGDEFIVILPGSDSNDAKKVCDGISNKCYLKENVLVDITTGYSTKENRNMSLRKVLIKADEDMYRNK